MWKMDEAMCSVNEYTIVYYEVKTYNRYCQSLHYNEEFFKSIVSNVNFKCCCVLLFSELAIYYLKLKEARIVVFEDFGGACV